MTRHVIVFYTRAVNGGYIERLGSDGVAFPDNRLSRSNMEAWARELGKKRPNVCGFRLACGARLENLFFLNAAVQPL